MARSVPQAESRARVVQAWRQLVAITFENEGEEGVIQLLLRQRLEAFQFYVRRASIRVLPALARCTLSTC